MCPNNTVGQWCWEMEMGYQRKMLTEHAEPQQMRCNYRGLSGHLIVISTSELQYSHVQMRTNWPDRAVIKSSGIIDTQACCKLVGSWLCIRKCSFCRLGKTKTHWFTDAKKEFSLWDLSSQADNNVVPFKPKFHYVHTSALHMWEKVILLDWWRRYIAMYLCHYSWGYRLKSLRFTVGSVLQQPGRVCGAFGAPQLSTSLGTVAHFLNGKHMNCSSDAWKIWLFKSEARQLWPYKAVYIHPLCGKLVIGIRQRE